ncbi:unnamed protein product [Cyclocybe aegerita]|uniref:Uncharacterized protein n=1 Tax=Cyclocybe aegerita TaxID=1973307 RepID=A0A8S0X023_CYCAE|nr:unnamed protein product [Cyclocybe aegerita]
MAKLSRHGHQRPLERKTQGNHLFHRTPATYRSDAMKLSLLSSVAAIAAIQVGAMNIPITSTVIPQVATASTVVIYPWPSSALVTPAVSVSTYIGSGDGPTTVSVGPSPARSQFFRGAHGHLRILGRRYYHLPGFRKLESHGLVRIRNRFASHLFLPSTGDHRDSVPQLRLVHYRTSSAVLNATSAVSSISPNATTTGISQNLNNQDQQTGSATAVRNGKAGIAIGIFAVFAVLL